MKICQFLASAGGGGLEKHTQELCNELAKTQDVTLIAPAEMQQYLSKNVHFIPLNFNRSRYNPLLLWDLLKILRKGNYDIIHAQANKAASLLAMLQNYVPGCAIGTIHNSNANKGRAFKNIPHVIAVSKEAADRVAGGTQASIVYNGVKNLTPDLSYTKEQLCKQFGLENQRPLLCAIGRLVSAKGFDLLIAALRDVDVNLLIVGDGPLKTALQQQIECLALKSRIVLTGYRNDVVDILNGVDGVVISSRNEGFSYVFAEAMLLNKPVISTDVPVANEFLAADLLTDKNESSIANKIAEYAFNPQRWIEKMQPTFTATSGRFTLDAMTNDTLAVYQKVIANKSN
ncbi:MAG: glycosyltransferase [Methylococcales bacterium]|nr:glycosyltransferase [Methylococcaceae bacterium]